MKLQDREKKLLVGWAVVMTLGLGWWATSKDDGPAPVVQAVDNIPSAEQRLARLRQLAASVPGKQEVLEQVTAELAAREKGLIQADTAAQAQAQLLQILRKLGKAQSSPIDMRNSEIGQVKPYGDKYGEVAVSLSFEAHIEQLVQLLSDLTAQKEIIGVNDLRVGTANPKEKTVPVRLTVSGLVRRELVPDKKGPASL
jgi:hypothetical protein